MESFFRVQDNHVTVSPHASGPWSPDMQHGGAPSALAVWAAQQVASAAPMRVARLTVDLLRPVPVAPLTFRTEVLREGRKIQLIAVHLENKGVEVARASVLKVIRSTQDLSSIANTPSLELPPPEEGQERRAPERSAVSFGANASLRTVKGEFGKPGPAAIWFRMNRNFVEGHETTPAMRAAATADFSNGISSELDFAKWTFINADLTVSLARDPEGDWILNDAKTWLGHDGGGIAQTRLADRRGYFGHATQNLIIEPREIRAGT